MTVTLYIQRRRPYRSAIRMHKGVENELAERQDRLRFLIEMRQALNGNELSDDDMHRELQRRGKQFINSNNAPAAAGGKSRQRQRQRKQNKNYRKTKRRNTHQ